MYILELVNPGSVALGMLIGVIPLVISLMFARRYNFLHGLFTFLFLSALFMDLRPILVEQLDKLEGFNAISGAATAIGGSLSILPISIIGFLVDLDFLPKMITDLLANDWVMTIIFGVIFLISQIFASIIRKHRKNKQKRLAKKAIRY